MQEPEIGPVVAKIMGNVLICRHVIRENGLTSVRIDVENHGDLSRTFKLHDLLGQEAISVDPPARKAQIKDGYDYNWKLALKSGERATICYKIPTDDAPFSAPIVEGLSEEMVTGAKVILS